MHLYFIYKHYCFVECYLRLNYTTLLRCYALLTLTLDVCAFQPVRGDSEGDQLQRRVGQHPVRRSVPHLHHPGEAVAERGVSRGRPLRARCRQRRRRSVSDVIGPNMAARLGCGQQACLAFGTRDKFEVNEVFNFC